MRRQILSIPLMLTMALTALMTVAIVRHVNPTPNSPRQRQQDLPCIHRPHQAQQPTTLPCGV